MRTWKYIGRTIKRKDIFTSTKKKRKLVARAWQKLCEAIIVYIVHSSSPAWSRKATRCNHLDRRAERTIHRDRMLTNINSGYGRWWLEWRKYFPLRDHEGSTITGFFTKNRFLFFFSRWQITNVAYSATAEGNVRRMVSQRVKNSEQTVQDEMTISTCTSKGTGKRGEPSSSSTLHGSIVNAPACKSSN